MDDEVEARLDTLERAITDGQCDLSELAADAEAIERLATLETTVEELEDQVTELEAATQALRGYVGNIRAVNQDVEQRADAALATAEKLQAQLEETSLEGETSPGGETSLDPEVNSPSQPQSKTHPQSASESQSTSTSQSRTTTQSCCAACGQPTEQTTPGSPRQHGSETTGGTASAGRPVTDERTHQKEPGTATDGGLNAHESGQNGHVSGQNPHECGQPTESRDEPGAKTSQTASNTSGTLARIRNLL